MTLRDDLLRRAATAEAMSCVGCDAERRRAHAHEARVARMAAEKIPAEPDATAEAKLRAELAKITDERNACRAQLAEAERERDEAIASCVRAFGEIAAWRELACSWVADASRADGEVSRDALEKRLRELSVTESQCRKLQAIVIGSLAEASRVFE